MICVSKKAVFTGLIIIVTVISLLTAYNISRKRNIAKTEAAPRKVIGGKEADPGEWPFMAALYNKTRFEKNKSIKEAFFCGGALIGPEWILTAAHCVKPPFIKKTEDVKVLLNFTDLTDKKNPGKSIDVEKVIIHENYINDNFATINNDIALLKLAKKQTTPYISINALQSLIKKDLKGYVLGWGVTSPGSNKPSDKLMELDLSVLLYKNQGTLYKNIYFAYDYRGGGGSYGDSGGPLVIWNRNKYYLAGVNSKLVYYRDWDDPSSSRLSGHDLTNTSKYIGWIKDKTGLDLTKINQTSFSGKPPDWISPTPKK